MVDGNEDGLSWHQVLQFFGKGLAESMIVLYGIVWNNIHGNQIIFIGVKETMYLDKFLMLGKSRHHKGLKFFPLIVAGGYCIDTHGHHYPVIPEHLRGNPARKTMDILGRKGIVNADMKRTDHYLWAIVVQDYIIYAVNLLISHHFLLDLGNKLCRGMGAKKLPYRREEHLYTGLDYHE